LWPDLKLNGARTSTSPEGVETGGDASQLADERYAGRPPALAASSAANRSSISRSAVILALVYQPRGRPGEIQRQPSASRCGVNKGKLMESETLAEQAKHNSKEQFANSPDLNDEIMNAIIGAFAAHSTMSKQTPDSEDVRRGLKEILLRPGQ
jgi:hypothetical protein